MPIFHLLKAIHPTRYIAFFAFISVLIGYILFRFNATALHNYQKGYEAAKAENQEAFVAAATQAIELSLERQVELRERLLMARRNVDGKTTAARVIVKQAEVDLKTPVPKEIVTSWNTVIETYFPR